MKGRKELAGKMVVKELRVSGNQNISYAWIGTSKNEFNKVYKTIMPEVP